MSELHPGNPIYDPTQPEHVSSTQIVEKFIAGAPETRGVYQGGELVEDGVYISPNTSLSSGEHLPQLTNVELLPGVQLGAGDSLHGVVFGRVAIEVDDEHRVVEAAIKPFKGDASEGSATNEHNRLLDAAKLGFDALKPVALAKDGSVEYLVTELRDDLTTLDNVDWTISPSDPRYESEVVPNLRFIAENTGLMHAKGLFSGDPQPKNYVRSDTGKLVVMDLEAAAVAQTPEELAQMMSGGYDVRDSKAYQEMSQLWYAMTNPMGASNPNNLFLPEEEFETCMAEYEKHLLNPYIEALEQHMTPDLAAHVDLNELRQALYTRASY